MGLGTNAFACIPEPVEAKLKKDILEKTPNMAQAMGAVLAELQSHSDKPLEDDQTIDQILDGEENAFLKRFPVLDWMKRYEGSEGRTFSNLTVGELRAELAASINPTFVVECHPDGEDVPISILRTGIDRYTRLSDPCSFVGFYNEDSGLSGVDGICGL